MLETFIFHVLCYARSDYSLLHCPILCDAVVLLQKEGIIHATAALNPCHLPDNVLRMLTRHPMKQIVLTSCSVVTENDDNTSFLLPLIPTPDEFWLEEGPDMVEWDVQFDFSVAERMQQASTIIRLLEQPLPVFVDKRDTEEEIMVLNEVKNELLQVTNATDPASTTSCEPQPARSLLATTLSHQEQKPVAKPGLTTPSSFASNDYDKSQVPQPKPIKDNLSPLELYLQQEVAKNDRFIGFLSIVTIVLLTIFGWVGYHIISSTKTTSTKTNHRQSIADDIQKQWLAKQHIRRQNRLTVEKPFLLKPIVTTTTDPRTKLAELKAVFKRPESVSPPRPIKSPPRLVATRSPPQIVVLPSSTTKNAKMKSFDDELRSKLDKSGLTVNKNASATAAVSWEDLM